MSDQDQKNTRLAFADVERALLAGDVDAAGLLKRFLAQPDEEQKASGAINTDELQRRLGVARRKRSKAERIKASTEVWRTFLNQPAPLPERFAVADLIVRLYQHGNAHGLDAGRALIISLVNEVKWDLGFFGGIKRVSKLAEDELDAVTWAAIAGRCPNGGGSSSGATRTYLNKRAWRFLRDLGRAMPELYPWWATEYLLRCDSYTSASSNIERTLNGKHRSFKMLGETWSKRPEPLLLIIQGASKPSAVQAAFAALKKHHADVLKAPDATWLKSLLNDDNVSRHEVFVELAKAVPAFAHNQLVALGLAPALLRLLRSRSNNVREFAQAFVRSEKASLSNEALVGVFNDGDASELKVVADILKAIPPRDLGPALLVRLLGKKSFMGFADKALLEQFSAAELPEQLLIDLAFDDDNDGFEMFEKLAKKHSFSTGLYKRLLEDDRLEDDYNVPDAAIAALKKKPTDEIGADWLFDIVSKKKDKLASDVSGWLSDVKKFPELSTPASIERAKGFLFDSDLKDVGLAILANKHLVTPSHLGIPWLLSLARRKDAQLAEFANRTLLEHMAPADFAGEGEGTSNRTERGITRLFELALSSTEAPALRTFAQTYLRCHHTEIGPQQAEAKQLGLKPQLPRTAFSVERVWPALKNVNEDIRRFAVTIAKVELRRWSVMGRLGEIADTDAVDVRRLALDALLKADDPAADPACTAKIDELSPETIFPLTESRRRPVREAGMELIRRHYSRLGGQERLAWLMTSADREVRLFAVRILWEKHRPRAFVKPGQPSSWQPKTSKLDPAVLSGEAGRFTDVEALRGFLRRVLFALPPGRSMEARDDKSFRRIPSSVAKARVIEIVRDLAVEDVAFANAVRPLLEEMTGSLAQGEWQACLQALCAIDAAHGRPALSSVSTTTANAAE
jgi:hypothetical protein